jgi:hypothetical protein
MGMTGPAAITGVAMMGSIRRRLDVFMRRLLARPGVAA